MPVNDNVGRSLIEEEFGLSVEQLGEEMLNYFVSVIESSVDDQEDATETLGDLLHGFIDGDSLPVAKRAIDKYLLSQQQTTTILPPNDNINLLTNQLNQNIQIEHETPKPEVEKPEPIVIISSKERRRLKKLKRRGIDPNAAPKDKKPEKFVVEPPKFPGFRRPTKLGGGKNISLHEPFVAIGGTVIVEGYESLTLQYPRKYGLIGENGSGKSTLLRFLSSRELKGIPDTASVYHVEQEIQGNEDSVLLSVLSADLELFELLNEENRLYAEDPENPRILKIYDRLFELDYDTAVTRASIILAGLSFTTEMQKRPTNEFSGGWLMRISLAKALFCSPDILLLDEPTNHLDFHAITWLEQFLKEWEGTLVVVSHQVSFLNAVCTDMIVLSDRQLSIYSHKYTDALSHESRSDPALIQSLEKTRSQFIHDYQHFAAHHPTSGHRMEKLIRLARKASIYAFMGGQNSFRFTSPEFNGNFAINMDSCSFAYPSDGGEEKKWILRNVSQSFGIQSRIALVGRNGCGKTTLLKLLAKELTPDEGEIEHANTLRVSIFTQDFVNQLDMKITPLQYLSNLFPRMKQEQIIQQIRTVGLEHPLENRNIQLLSGGQKSRLVFAKIGCERPNVLLLDEPSNHLDIQASQNLARGLGLFEGAIIMVSHDEKLISTVCDEILYINDLNLYKWTKSVHLYKEHVLNEIEAENRARKQKKKNIKKFLTKRK